MFPFWKAFFTELGYRVILSDVTNKELIRKGVENVVAETCFPIKVSHGHILNLLEKGVKRIFLPSIINLKPSHPGDPEQPGLPLRPIPSLCGPFLHRFQEGPGGSPPARLQFRPWKGKA